MPTEEHHRFVPANLVVVEPGVVIMPGEARVTVKALEAAGVKVIGFDSSGIMQGGTNGIKCITMELDRDDGPEAQRMSRLSVPDIPMRGALLALYCRSSC